MAGSWRTLDDPYMAARAWTNVDAVGRQVLARLAGVDIQVRLSAPGLVIANELTPGTCRARPIHGARPGMCRGGAHLAQRHPGPGIGIPAVVALGPGLLAVEEGITLVVDGDAGLVVVDHSTRWRRSSRTRRRAAPKRSTRPDVMRHNRR